MNTIAARKYPNRRAGPLNPTETETRRLAYTIKEPAALAADVETAACEMAALLQPGPCYLVPIPNSKGSILANARLAAHIARHHPGAQVVKAITRTRQVESQCARHRLNLGPIPIDEHYLRATGKALALRPLYFVDNVTTSGNTLAAAKAALGRGAGLVFANAGATQAPGQPTLF